MLPRRIILPALSFCAPNAICSAKALRKAPQAIRPASSPAPPSRALHTSMHSSLALALSPHFKKLHLLRESADARRALAGGKFREALRESERMGEIAAACRDDGMRAAAIYFRASVASFSGLWDVEHAQLSQLHALSSSPEFPAHFKTAVALLMASAQLKHSSHVSVLPSEEDAAAAGMQ